MSQQRFLKRVSWGVMFVMMLWAAEAAEAQAVTGSGTPGRITKWTGTYPSTTIEDSLIFESGGMLGVNTLSPQGMLHVTSSTTSTALQLQTTFPGIVLGMRDSWTTATYGAAIARIADDVELRTMDTPRLIVAADGKVVITPIGWAIAPTHQLTVDADAGGIMATDTGNAQLVLRGATDTGMRLGVGVNTSYHYARIQGGHDGSPMTLSLQPAGGRVGIGTASPTDLLHVNGDAKVAGVLKVLDVTPGGDAYVTWESSDGSLHYAPPPGLSSLRYKTAVRDLTGDARAVLDLRPVHFEWISNGQPDIGLIAEEVVKVLPDLVTNDKEGRPMSVKYDKVPLYLLQVVRAQQSQITALEEQHRSEITTLENKYQSQISALEVRLQTLETSIARIGRLPAGGGL